LPSVQHVNLVFVQLRKQAIPEPTAAGIGLPGHDSFITGGNRGDRQREWRWLLPGECAEFKLDGLASRVRTVSQNWGLSSSLSSQPWTAESFAEYLAGMGVRTSEWTGVDGTRTVADLLREIEDGSSSLVHDEQKGLQRTKTIAMVQIWSPNRFIFVRVGSGSANGEFEWRLELLGGSVQKDENALDAARRLLWEHLQIEEDDFDFMTERSLERSSWVEEPRAYPGLPTKVQQISVDAMLSDDDFLLDRLNLQQDRPNVPLAPIVEVSHTRAPGRRFKTPAGLNIPIFVDDIDD